MPGGHWWAEPRTELAVVLWLAAVLFFSHLAGNGLPNYDDAYYAQKAKEILHSGDWLTLTHNRQPRFDNPPFFMWLVAISFAVFGVSDLAARLPSALLGVATVALTWSFGRRLAGDGAGFLSASVLATTLLFARYARRAMTDVTLTFFVCLALYALVRALGNERRWFLVGGVALGVAVLTKSVLGLFPLAITVLYLLGTRRAAVLRDAWFLAGAALAVVVGGSWYLYEYALFGAPFVKVHFAWLIVERAVGLEPQPWTAHLSYFKELGVNYWPWLPVLVWGAVEWVRSREKQTEARGLPLLWMATMLVGLSVPQSRVVWYMLPAFPAAALVCGITLDRRLGERGRRAAVAGVAALAGVALAAIYLAPIELTPPRETDVRALAPVVKFYGDRGATVIAYRQVYHRLNNALLFYSDHVAWPSYESPAELAAAMSGPGLVLCVLGRAELPAVQRDVPGLVVWLGTDHLALVANRAALGTEPTR